MFCIAFASDHVQDVTWRYVTDFNQTIRRRNINEKQFGKLIQKMNRDIQRQLNQQQRQFIVPLFVIRIERFGIGDLFL